MKTHELMGLLERRHAGNAWAFFEQVRDAAGFNAGRTADAVAMSLWPSRGLNLHGFEVKVTRYDWQRELRNPAKAETINRYCDYWWLVVASKDLVKEGELPETWGLLTPDGGGDLSVVRQAPRLSPVAIDRDFLACLLRRAYEARPAAKEIAAAEQRGKDKAMKARDWSLESSQRDLTALQEKVRAFEQASGVQIAAGWHLDNVGRAVHAVLNGKHLEAERELEHLEARLGRVLAAVREERGALSPAALEAVHGS